MKHNPIIIALDVETALQARTLVDRIGDAVDFYKVGLELFASAGMDFVAELTAARKQVFLDLKFHDIGETVKRAVAQVANRGVRFLTIHATDTVMRAAVGGKAGSNLQLLGVTVLTDIDQRDLERMGYSCSLEELVARRAWNAAEIGVDGLVCSPLEVAKVRQIVGPATLLVTPGVRSAGAATGDQKRIATPGEAIRNGADYLVIGRQVTRAEDPEAEVNRILEELATGIVKKPESDAIYNS
jgi:orotidine-5'-phosphate decarboxylase